MLAIVLMLSALAHASAAYFTPIKIGSKLLLIVAGEIEVDDDLIFESAIADKTDVLVLFESPGGKLLAGLNIGKAIRSRNLDTAVADGQECASACALAWLAGAHRFMGRNSLVGFHAASTKDDLGMPQESGWGNALVGYYFAHLGISEQAVFYLTRRHPNDIEWLTLDHARELSAIPSFRLCKQPAEFGCF